MNSFNDKGTLAPKRNFTGTVWVKMDVTPSDGYNVNIGTISIRADF
ncbi:MAG: hypothetical protein WCX48_09960 [Bacteroidales bacterium]